MKIKLLNNLLIVDILTVLLIGAILLIPDSWARTVLGLPFLLYFPGYVLVEALFVGRKGELQAASNKQQAPSPELEAGNSKLETRNSSPAGNPPPLKKGDLKGDFPSPETGNSKLETRNSSPAGNPPPLKKGDLKGDFPSPETGNSKLETRNSSPAGNPPPLKKGELKGDFPSLETSNVPRPTSNVPAPSPPPSNVERPTSNAPAAVERLALSFGMSIALTALIGLGLNYTPWGIRLLPVLFAISAFIFIFSAVALFRRRRLDGEWGFIRSGTFKLPGWEGSPLNKSLNIILLFAFLGVIGVLIYTVAFPKVGEKFTEFYILGLEGKADRYPSQFTLDAGQNVISAAYGQSTVPVLESHARLTLGIIDQEQQPAAYAVELKVDGQSVPILHEGRSLTRLEAIDLIQGQKWEGQIAFAPQHPGPNQKVEFLLYKDGAGQVYQSLHIWVNVVEE